MRDMSNLDPGDIDLATLSWLAGSAANDYLLAAIRAAGHPRLRLSHGYVFQLLIEGPRTIGEIAEGLGVTQQAASKTVGELVSLRYVASIPDEADRRIRRVALSTRGERAVADARAARARLEEKLRAAIGPQAMRAARTALLSVLEMSGGLDATRQRRVRPPTLT